MKDIVLYSPYECLIKSNNNEMMMNENEHITLVATDLIYVYPVGRTKKYSFVIDINDKDNQFYSVIEKDDKYLVFLVDGLLSQNSEIFNFKYNNLESFIEVSSHAVTFKTKNNKKKIYIYQKPNTVKCGNFSFIDYVLLELNKSNLLVAYNVKNNNAKQFSGEKIEIKTNGFKIYSSKNIYDNIEEEYYIDNEGLKLKDKSFVMAEQKYPDELIPYQFMCAVKNGDTNLMNNLLDENIKEKLSIDDVKSYFGNIEYFYMIDCRTCFALSDRQNVIYEFYVKNHKINEISDNKKQDLT